MTNCLLILCFIVLCILVSFVAYSLKTARLPYESFQTPDLLDFYMYLHNQVFNKETVVSTNYKEIMTGVLNELVNRLGNNLAPLLLQHQIKNTVTDDELNNIIKKFEEETGGECS